MWKAHRRTVAVDAGKVRWPPSAYPQARRRDHRHQPARARRRTAANPRGRREQLFRRLHHRWRSDRRHAARLRCTAHRRRGDWRAALHRAPSAVDEPAGLIPASTHSARRYGVQPRAENRHVCPAQSPQCRRRRLQTHGRALHRRSSGIGRHAAQIQVLRDGLVHRRQDQREAERLVADLRWREDQPAGNVTIPPNHEIPATGQVVECCYLYAFRESGSIYQPVYLGSRDDITAEECSTAQLKYKAEALAA